MVTDFWVDQLPPSLANFLESYEVVVYAYTSDYIAVAFFQGSQSASWLAFAVSFVGRPVGGLLFGCLSDRQGRRTSMLTSLYLTYGATLGLGLAPRVPYLGPAWIVLCRFLQGIGLAGQVGSVGVLLPESAPRPILAQAGGPIVTSGWFGFVSALGVTMFFTTTLSPAQMQSGGWRLPFLTIVLPGALLLSIAHQATESPEFEHAHRPDSGEAALCPSARLPAAVLANAGALFGPSSLYLTFVCLQDWLMMHCKKTTVICQLMYPAKSLAMYPFWGFFRLLKVGTKVQ